MRFCIVYLILWLGAAFSQTKLDIKNQTQNADLGGFSSTKPMKLVGTLPVECLSGEAVFLQDPAGSMKMHGCGPNNIWTKLEGPATIQGEGINIGSRNIVNFIPGAGLITTVADTGLKINVQNELNTAVFMTQASFQAGIPTLCSSLSGSNAAFTCALSPTLTSYSTGLLLRWIPDVSSISGAVTLNIDGLGARAVKLADGTTDPSSNDIVANRMALIWYDGTNFRLLTRSSSVDQPQLCQSGSASSSIFTCALSPTLTSYSTGLLLRWIPDVSSISGAVTLNIDGLGARAVKLADGTTDPSSNDIVANRMALIWYDGTNFRLLNEAPRLLPQRSLAASRPSCTSTLRGQLWFSDGGTGVKDILAVCAKDASDAYSWRTLY